MLAFPRLVKTLFKNPCSTRENLILNFSVTLKTGKKGPKCHQYYADKTGERIADYKVYLHCRKKENLKRSHVKQMFQNIDLITVMTQQGNLL